MPWVPGSDPCYPTLPLKRTTMPAKPWRDLAVDLMGPLPTGESLLVTVDYYSRWIEATVDRNTTSGSIINCLEKHFTRHGIPETLRMDNGSNLVNTRWRNSWMSWRSSIRGLFLCGREQMERWSDKTSHCLRQCVWPMLKENHGNENCRNIS